MDTLWGTAYGPPVSLGADDIVPAVAGIACGLSKGRRFRSSTYRRHLQTVAANLVAAADLSGLPPYSSTSQDDAWSERFRAHSQVVVNILDAWTDEGRIEVLQTKGRDRLFRMKPARGMARLLGNVARCEEGLRSLRVDLLLLSMQVTAVYDVELLATRLPSLQKRRPGRVRSAPTLAEFWDLDFVTDRFLRVLTTRRDALRRRARDVRAMNAMLRPFIDANLAVPDALAQVQQRLPHDDEPVLPGLFAWKRQRAGDLEPGLERLSTMYRPWPEQIARRDLQYGMPTRASVLYEGTADLIDAMASTLENARRELKRALR